MSKTLTALAAAATVAITAVATTTSAEAQWRWRGGWGWRGPAFVGGLATGAFIGAAYTRSYYGYGSGYGPYASYGYYGGPYAAYAYYPAPYVAYAAPVYTGYPVYGVYSGCRPWNGYSWGGYYGC